MTGPGRQATARARLPRPRIASKCSGNAIAIAHSRFEPRRNHDTGLRRAAALDRVRNPEHPRITRCFVCHDSEEDEPGVPGGRSSLALRPRARTLVDITTLRAELERCDHQVEPARCRWLAALFSHGPVERRAFEAELPVL